MADDAVCILCASREVEEVQTLIVADVIRGWKDVFDLDVRAEFHATSRIARLKCRRCGLEYYRPALAGSERMYQDLQTFPWYYARDKWEYRTALRDIAPGARVLEVGCGVGAFLEIAKTERCAEAAGIELNAAAAASARQLGRAVSVEDVRSVAAREAGRYDVVCHFQVLEHVARPHEFLDACVRLLRPAGRLCIAVPNNDGYLKTLSTSLLNQPPHHVSRWGAQTLDYLPRLLPIAPRRMAHETLAHIHIGDYVGAWFERFDLARKPRLIRGASRRLALFAIDTLGVHRVLRGHTVYASYSRL